MFVHWHKALVLTSTGSEIQTQKYFRALILPCLCYSSEAPEESSEECKQLY